MRGIGSMALHGNDEEAVTVQVEWVADVVSGALVNDDKLNGGQERQKWT